MWAKLAAQFLVYLAKELVTSVVGPLIKGGIKAWEKAKRLKEKVATNRKKTEAVENAQTTEEGEDAFGKAP